MHIPEDEAERRRLNERGREILRRKNGAVRPHREDGYVNLLNKYGTKQDNSEAYKFEREPVIPDMQLTGCMRETVCSPKSLIRLPRKR